MNELQKRFAKKVLSPQQKKLIVEEASRSNRGFKFIPIVVPSFFVILAVLFLATLNDQSLKETTSATGGGIISMNFFLNMCNILLIIGVCMHIVKLMKDRQWLLPKKWGRFVPKTAIIWIVVAIIGYSIVDAYIGGGSYYKEILFALLLLLLLTLYIIFPSDSISGSRAIINKIIFTLAIIGILVSFIINWTIDPLDRINATSIVFNFPTNVNWEPYRIGKIGAFLFVMCTILLIGTLKKYRAITLAMLFFILHAVPGTINYVQQTFFAENAGAIYSYNDGSCHYQGNSHGVIDYNCKVTLKNRSNESATFTLELYEPHADEQYATIDVLNMEGPFTYTFKPKEKLVVVIEGQLSMAHLPSQRQLYSGNTPIYLKIFDSKSQFYR